MQPRAEALCQAALTSRSGHWHRQAPVGSRARPRAKPLPRGKRKPGGLKSSRHWVLSLCFGHRSCWRTSRLLLTALLRSPEKEKLKSSLGAAVIRLPELGLCQNHCELEEELPPLGASWSPALLRWPLAQAQCLFPGLMEQEAAPLGASSSKCCRCAIPPGTASCLQPACRKAATCNPPSPTR